MCGMSSCAHWVFGFNLQQQNTVKPVHQIRSNTDFLSHSENVHLST